jgi:hypothetical protein
MIIFIEGTRHSGKTYLLNQLIERHGASLNLFYYKFYLANEYSAIVKDWDKSDKGIHYFSMGNIMTILDLHKQFPEKIFVFDRAHITAATWATLWNRITFDEAQAELAGLINRPGYQDCKTIMIDAPDQFKQDQARQKDLWDGLISPSEEKRIMHSLIQSAPWTFKEGRLGNSFNNFTNNFNPESVDEFCELIQKLVRDK